MPFQLVKSIRRHGSVNGTVFPFLISFRPTPRPFSVLSQLCGPVEGTELLDLMRLVLNKQLPQALLHKPAHSRGAWHLDHIHFLLCVSAFSYIHLIPHEECIVSIRDCESLRRPILTAPWLKSLAWAGCSQQSVLSAVDDRKGGDPLSSVCNMQTWQRHSSTTKAGAHLCRCCESCQSLAFLTVIAYK